MKRFLGVAAIALSLAACGDKAEKGAADKAEGGDSVAASAVTAPAEATEGTWGAILYGDPNAPVEIVEYASLTCPHCAHFANDILPAIKEKYVDTGKVKISYRNFIMNQVDLAASTVARCGDMEMTQKLMAAFFETQGEWAHSQDQRAILDALARTARRAGMSRTEFDRCLANTDMHKHLVEMTQEGVNKFEVNSTPTLFVNGKKLDNYLGETVEAAVEAALK